MWQLVEPKALWLLVIPGGLALFFLLKKKNKNSPQLIPFTGPASLMAEESRRARRLMKIFFATLLLCFTGLVLVASRPVLISSWLKKTSQGIDIVLVFDVSESMEATDFAPTRMIVAKALLKDFIKKRTEDRIGFVAFGGEAVTKCPLTRDYDFLLSQIDILQMRELKQGTAIGMGLTNGISRLRNSTAKSKVIVLITDGDSNVGSINPITAAHLARQEGIKIYSIGIGKQNRVVVPIYALDPRGHKTQVIAQVPSYLNPALLAEISQITGGKSYMARDSGMLSRFLNEIDRLEKTRINQQLMNRQDEIFFWPAAILTVILLICFLFLETRYRKAGPDGFSV